MIPWYAVALAGLLVVPLSLPGQQSTTSTTSTTSSLTSAELDELLAPIALYPDPLLAQILPASTFVNQIDAAQRALNGKVDEGKIEKADWDVSVKAVAHYPTVLSMMAGKQEWTTALGQAFVNQPKDVMQSVQRLRKQAQEAGNLTSNDKQKVEKDGDNIVIAPAQPAVVYVPVYDPGLVYGYPYSTYPYYYGYGYPAYYGATPGEVAAVGAISFGAGLAIGAWLNNDCNWSSGSVYYHGWHGGGWVGVSAGHVNVNNNVYVNNRYNRNGSVNVNRGVDNYNTSGYRQQLSANANTARQNRSYGNSQNLKSNPNYEAAKGRAPQTRSSPSAAAQPARQAAPSSGGSSRSAFSGSSAGSQAARNSARGRASMGRRGGRGR